MSERGAARCPRLAEKTGVVTGGSRNPSSIHVQFEGNLTPTALHKDYVEPIGLAEHETDLALPRNNKRSVGN